MSAIEEILVNMKINDPIFINIMENINLKEEIELYLFDKSVSFSEDYPYDASIQLDYINEDIEIKSIDFEKINESEYMISIEISNTIEYTKLYKDPLYDSSIDNSNEEFLYNLNNEAILKLQLDAYIDFYSNEINDINDDLDITKVELTDIFFEEI